MNPEQLKTLARFTPEQRDFALICLLDFFGNLDPESIPGPMSEEFFQISARLEQPALFEPNDLTAPFENQLELD